MSSITFFFSSLCSFLPPHFLAVVFLPASMYHISLFFLRGSFWAWGQGWNKADPHFQADRVSKVWTGGQHLPSLPAQPQPDRGRVRQRCGLLQASGRWWGGERNTTRRVIWCSFDPLNPPRWKGFQFYQTRKTTSAQNPLRASKLSRIFNRRQITVYCGMCTLCSITVA